MTVHMSTVYVLKCIYYIIEKLLLNSYIKKKKKKEILSGFLVTIFVGHLYHKHKPYMRLCGCIFMVIWWPRAMPRDYRIYYIFFKCIYVHTYERCVQYLNKTTFTRKYLCTLYFFFFFFFVFSTFPIWLKLL